MVAVLIHQVDRGNAVQQDTLEFGLRSLDVSFPQGFMKPCKPARPTGHLPEALHNLAAEYERHLVIRDAQATQQYVVSWVLNVVGGEIARQIEQAPKLLAAHPVLGEHHLKVKRGFQHSLRLQKAVDVGQGLAVERAEASPIGVFDAVFAQ